MYPEKKDYIWKMNCEHKKASRSPLQMFPQRNNPYCDLLIYCPAKVGKITL